MFDIIEEQFAVSDFRFPTFPFYWTHKIFWKSTQIDIPYSVWLPRYRIYTLHFPFLVIKQLRVLNLVLNISIWCTCSQFHESFCNYSLDGHAKFLGFIFTTALYRKVDVWKPKCTEKLFKVLVVALNLVLFLLMSVI